MIPVAASLVCLGAPRQRKPRAPLSSVRVGGPTAGGDDAGGGPVGAQCHQAVDAFQGGRGGRQSQGHPQWRPFLSWQPGCTDQVWKAEGERECLLGSVNPGGRGCQERLAGITALPLLLDAFYHHCLSSRASLNIHTLPSPE